MKSNESSTKISSAPFIQTDTATVNYDPSWNAELVVNDSAATRETRGTLGADDCAHERTEYWLGNTYCVLCRKWLNAGRDAPLRIKTCPKCGASISWILECDNGHEFQGPEWRAAAPAGTQPAQDTTEIFWTDDNKFLAQEHECQNAVRPENNKLNK
jgi:hypothetical protein